MTGSCGWEKGSEEKRSRERHGLCSYSESWPLHCLLFLPLDRSTFLAPPHTFRRLLSLLPSSLSLFSSCASFGFMYCACTCWIAASECTHEGLQDFQSFVATAAFPPHTSPSSRPPSHSFPLMGAERNTHICFTLLELDSPQLIGFPYALWFLLNVQTVHVLEENY